MLIKRVNKIKNFGIFKDFNWDAAVPDFNVFNLTYGWNYSGKTTLSRVFRCFEMGQMHHDYPSAAFEVESLDGTKFSALSFPHKLLIKVFNSDFVVENLRWNEGLLPIFLLGEENIQLQEDLKNKKVELVDFTEKQSDLTKQKIELETKISNALTSKAKDIKLLLSLPVFDKRHLQLEIDGLPSDHASVVLKDADVSNLISKYKSVEKKSPVKEINISAPDLQSLYETIKVIMGATVKSKVIERLKANPPVGAWVKTGKNLHEGKDTCEFCGNLLPPDLLSQLNNHFSDDYENLISDIRKKQSNVESQKIAITLPDAANLYQDLQNEYTEIKERLLIEIQAVNEQLENFIKHLEAKKEKVFDELQVLEVINDSSNLIGEIKLLNNVIRGHNLRTQEFEKEKTAALNQLLKHYASLFVQKEKLPASKKKIIELDTAIGIAAEDVKNVDKKVKEIEAKLSETVKGAETINKHLGQYFGKGDIVVKVTPDNKFQLLRGGKVAKNLSEGEKTAIAFAYFCTKVDEKNNVLSDTVIYIDDPISSLDANHLFNTYSFIRNKFYDDATRTLKCKQLFISTHNYEFFNLIKDWFLKVKVKYKSFYFVERTTNISDDQSSLVTLPNLLLKHKSEYCYLFSLIHQFKQTPSQSFEQLYNLPNVLRRFLEIFSTFKYLSSVNVDENLHCLILDPIKCERVRKFIHYHSHGMTITKLMQISDIKECTDIVDAVLSSIESHDKIHYDSLLLEVAAPSAAPTSP